MDREATRAALREEAIKRNQLLSQVEELASIELADCYGWTVRVRRVAGEHFLVNGRGSQMVVFLKKTLGGLLVSIPSHNRCGHVPLDCTEENIMQYCDFDNEVDAVTLSAAINTLVAAKKID